MTPAAAARALLLGLASAPSCATLCLPVMAPLLIASPKPGIRASALALALFATGRLAGYVLVGLLAGLLRAWRYPALFPILYLLLGTLVILYGVVQSFPGFRICRILRPHTVSGRYHLALGMLTGLNPCPPFLLATAAAAELGRPLAAILFFVFFFLGTSLWLLPLGLSGVLARFRPVQVAGRILAVIVGLWYIWLGAAAIK